MLIEYLADYQNFIPALAKWHHQEWAYLRPGASIEARITRIQGCCGHREIPTVLIALIGSTLIGSAMLIAHDMDTHTELSPWLAGVFVAPNYRRRGVGAALVARIIDEATGINVERLYLYTPSTKHFYSRLGWSLLEHTSYRGKKVAVMSYQCTANQSLVADAKGKHSVPEKS
jgi:N-acetylglutamate synthase-like GNAT family acetyltransferase